MATNTLSGVNKSGYESSTTHAAVSDGSLIVRNTEDQKQDISTLSRDTEHAANGLSPIFDKEKVLRQLQQAQMVGDISSQVLDIYNTNEAINATRKATEGMQNASTREDARTLAEKELKAEKDKNSSVTVDEETITKRAYQNLYNQALEHNQARLGDPMRQAVTASVAVLSGLAGGDIKAALANGAAPYLATGLKMMTGDDNPSDEQMAVRLLGHAIIGGVVAELNGAPVAGGVAGAVTGEVAAITISKLYFGKSPSQLTESEREQLSGMSTVAAALAGSLASDSAAGTVAGAQAGKNAVENNTFGPNTFFGQMANSVNPDATLAFDLMSKGTAVNEVGKAIKYNHQRPSWGVEYKVHPEFQAGGDISFIRGYTLGGTIDDYHISVNQGDIYSIGAHGSASVGLSFGPYFPGLIETKDKDYTINGGLGVGSVGLSAGKDGIGFNFGVGPSWGWSATEIKGVDVNGTSTTEIYRHDFK
ncbi:TPA: hypothetical protein G9F27_004690 [Salmonella enterica]|uniref:Uncharacterized protein n=1 Tax=Salmonella enterica TaxID=28901 RepID=A0A743P9K9_SALER|nr:hypothetical protein [Salmonella enterica]